MIKKQTAKFLLAWILANAVGGFLIGFLENNGAQFMATLIFSGAIIGSLQWAIFRWIGTSGLRWALWPLASGLGWIISTLIGILLPEPGFIAAATGSQLTQVLWLNLINQPVWIAGMAIAQGFILGFHSRQRFRILGVWLLASCLGAALNGAVSVVMGNAVFQALPNILSGMAQAKGWGSYGVITGLALLWVLKDSSVGVRSPLHRQG
ncbi:MAG: hypothetical protein AAGI45_21270 [Cyanobacteria bacterium P01_H01_bin.26]